MEFTFGSADSFLKIIFSYSHPNFGIRKFYPVLSFKYCFPLPCVPGSLEEQLLTICEVQISLTLLLSHLSLPWDIFPQAILRAQCGKKIFLNKRNCNAFPNVMFKCDLKWTAPKFKTLAITTKNTMHGKESRNHLVQNVHFAPK